MDRRAELCRSEDGTWAEILRLVESLRPEELERPGYSADGWSVKDLLAHLAAWQAEAGQVFGQIRNGTFERRRLDVDAMNRVFYDANKDQPLSVVRAEVYAARTRMLSGFANLPEVTPEAEEWFRESGPAHYDEHLQRLREWVRELQEMEAGSPSATA